MTPRRETIGDATLYRGDARELLSEIVCNAVITDPPYGISHQSGHGASWQNTVIAGDTDTTLRDEVLAAFPAVPVASFGTWKTPPIANVRGCLVFDKGPAFGMGDLSFPWKPSFELIYIRGDGWHGSRDEGVLRGHVQVSWETQFKGFEARSHPHQKPFSLIEALLQKLPHAHTIFDPFMGSGTTGVACARLRRRFIGVELDPKHFETALRRIEAAQRQGDLLRDRMPQPKPEQLTLGSK